GAVAPGQATITGGPADASPFQDTLLFNEDDPVNVAQIRYDSLTFTVNPSGTGLSGPLQNPTLAQDVNNDGLATPIDALIVINQLNREQSALEGESVSQSQLPQHFYDVTGDGSTTALDALNVINYLAVLANQGLGEGEQAIAQPLSTSTNLQSTNSTDSAIAELGKSELGKSELVTSVDTDASNEAQEVLNLDSISEDTDEEKDEDLLGLLADDVANLQQ
ncbi:MAG: dockerin type I domain-containing protein, partial [Pirellulales bacterium]|nr:dockerin type I domain-containing protein [Pirellulales bacterium]